MAKSMFIKHSHDNQYVLGFYSHESNLLKGVKGMMAEGHKIHNVITPFPVHGLDNALGMEKTRIPTIGFLVGITCGILMLCFMLWINMSSYPLIIGGKPQFSLPAFVPIWFEVSVLTASISMVVTFLYACRLKPGVKNEWNPIFDPGFTDDKMAVVFELPKDKSIEEVATVLKNHGAHEVLSKTLEDAQ
tara:strand:- start:896 stop:1462 length:567 start_codon:yes stop_codon:yes gene_type:complete